MKKILIEGGHPLTGTINISGAKNSAVALIPATILSNKKTKILNVPNITDKEALVDILKYLNCEVIEKDTILEIDTTNFENKPITSELASKLRASYYFMGVLLGKCKKVEIYSPGGCNIGARPIDIHLKGFESLGAKIKYENDYYIIEADELKGAKIYFDFASVGATINVMLAASLATGTTKIYNAAREPEIVNIASFLNNMGANITGAGTRTITIQGVKELHEATIEVIPDRIESATYIILGALTGKNLTIKSIIPEHQSYLLKKLSEVGVKYKTTNDSVTISKPKKYNPIHIKTLVYPGFPTDAAQPMSVVLTQCDGKSILEETIYENRMGHINYLQKMGANIKVDGQVAYFNGPSALQGTKVIATDLRAGATMILAGLTANGTTEILEVEHILRGYENIEEKLKNVGAKFRIEDI